MLTIRLQRVGKKHQPSYRVVVAERRSKLGGPPIEDLGFYNPFSKEAVLNKDRIDHWKSVGAHISPTVHNLCVAKNIVNAPKIAVKMRKRKNAEAPAAEPVAGGDAQKQETAPPNAT